MPETTPLIKAALNLRVGAGFDVYVVTWTFVDRQEKCLELITFELVSFLTRHSWLLTITIQYEYFVI